MDNSLPGIRFYPTEEMLLSFYLHNKLNNLRPDIARVIPDVNVFSFEPWLLQMISGELCRLDKEQWLFFSPRQERPPADSGNCRSTASGFWLRTGDQATIYSSTNRPLGIRNMWVFHKGQRESGQRTEWIVNEYHSYEDAAVTTTADTTVSDRILMDRAEFSLCRLLVESDRPRYYVNLQLQIPPGKFGSLDPQPPPNEDPAN